MIKALGNGRRRSRPSRRAVGGKLQSLWYAVGDHDGYVLAEVSDNTAAASTPLTNIALASPNRAPCGDSARDVPARALVSRAGQAACRGLGEWATIGAMSESASDDPRIAFVYQEGLRGLLQQQAAVESLHNRAATLVFAASFAGSLLGSRALADGVGGWDWLAISLLLAIGALTVALLWPYYNLSFRFDPEELLDTYVDAEPPVSMSDMHRELALRIKADWHRNGRIVHRLRELFQVALIILLAEIMAWMFSIAGV